MKLVYLRGKNPKILDDCGYNKRYEDYYRRLTRYDGVEWLDSGKILGEIYRGYFEPDFPHGITPTYIKKVAKSLNLRIKMKSPYGIDGYALYYYEGKYRPANKLFKRRIK